MWMYLGPSCPNCSFSIELDDAEIDAQIRGILVHGPSAFPLRERVVSPWVSLLKLIFI
jgi:hypothetical protein